MRRAAWIGSVAVHAAIAVGIGWCGGRTEVAPDEIADEIDVVEIARVVEAERPATPVKTEGGGGAGKAAKAHAPARRTRAATRGEGLVIEEEDRTQIGHGHGHGHGSGGGIGSGSGSGIGSGRGIGHGRDDLPPPTRVVVSKARPARLIWPKRQRDERDGEVFVAQLVVDDEGYVVGVRLTEAPVGRRADEAESAVWRFRYEPALDDDGRPVRTRVEQRFMVE